MPAVVRTTRLFRANGYSGAPTVQFAVPPLKVAVVTAITIVHGVQATSSEFWVEDDEGGRIAAATDAAGSSLKTFQWTSRWVFLPSETLSPATDSGATTCDFHVAGYLLDLP